MPGPPSRAGLLTALAVLLGGAATAQTPEPVLLETSSGNLSVSGRLVTYEGGTYTVATGLGELTLDGAALTCSGPACPAEMPAPVARPVSESPKFGVTLRSLSGTVRLNGVVQARDRESITLATVAGPITVPSDRVICDGAGCPDQTWPGLAEAGNALPGPEPGLVPDMATDIADTGSVGPAAVPATNVAPDGAGNEPSETDIRDVADSPVETAVEKQDSFHIVVTGPEFVLAPLLPALSGALDDDASASVEPLPVSAASEAGELVASGAADAVIRPWPVSRSEAEAAGEALIAHDALVPLVHPDNPLPRLSTVQLRAILEGTVTDWAELGNAAGPITLVGLTAGHPLSELRDTLLPPTAGNGAAAPQVQTDTVAVLAEEVALDPAAFGLGTLSLRGAARAVPLTSPCGHGIPADASTVRTGAYPLAYSIALAASPRGDLAAAALERVQEPGALDGSALIPTGLQPGPLDTLRARLADTLDDIDDGDVRPALETALRNAGAARQLPVVIRFDGGSNRLAPGAEAALAAVVDRASDGRFPELFLVGHAEETGDPEHSRELSRLAARLVRQVITRLDREGQLSGTVIRTVGLGALAPETCGPDATDDANRRVEVWVRG